MKRLIAIFLVVLSCVSFSACGKTQKEEVGASPEVNITEEEKEEKEETKQIIEEEENQEKKQEEKQETGNKQPAPSDNKTVVTEEEAPKVFWAMDMVYHTKKCKELKDKENREIPWSMVKELGLRQCPVCNPPRYEDYVE